ncbi:MAG: N-acetyl-lysine deacetylase [Myxococcota bacterium]|nr:N-acetyl-lysine deacetylase [Myxococcota bacterium]
MPKPSTLNEQDWRAAGDQAVEELRSLIRIDTTNPPGNERQAAEYMAELMSAAGLEPELLDCKPGRGNMTARLRGTGEEAPVVLVAHLDVVPAVEDTWKYPPFAGEIADGCVWGRGAIDMKNMAIMSAMTIRLLKREGLKPRRDLILCCVADEEVGCKHGSLFMVSEHKDKVQAEYMIGEVGGFTQHTAGMRIYPVQVAEKGVCWVKVRARGPAGHGSMPREDSSVVRLARAIDAIGSRRMPQHVVPVVENFIQRLAEVHPIPARWILPMVLNPALADVIINRVIPDKAVARSFKAMLSNTASPTVLRAGNKTNVIPAEAEAQVDGRTLPGQTTEDFLRELRAIAGDDLDYDVMEELPPTENNPRTPLFALMEQQIRKHDPGAIPVPYLIPGFTDAKAFSRIGTTCYGFSPLKIEADAGFRFSELYHCPNERIPIAGFQWGLRVLYDTVREFCT